MANYSTSYIYRLKDKMTPVMKKITRSFKRMYIKSRIAAKKMAKSFKKAGKNMKDMGKSILGAGVVVAGAIGVIVKSAADYEQSLVNMKAITQATGEEMKKLDALAMQLGRDTAWSAKEAVNGQIELAKAGLTTSRILGGALKSSLDLASSTTLDLSEASEMTAFGLKLFAHEGINAAKVANYFAAVENKSAGDARNLKEALTQVAPAVTALKLNFEDVNAALASFADNQIKGGRAGTGLRNTLLRLQPMSKEAADTMLRLGIITKNGANEFFTAGGKMEGLSKIAEVLKTKMSHLTEKELARDMDTMFGMQGLAGGIGLLKAGAKGIDEYKNKLAKVSAERLAEEKLKSLSGQMTILKGSIETSTIALGTTLLPILTPLAKNIAKVVNSITAWVQDNPKLSKTIMKVAAAVGGFLIVVGGASFIVGTLLTIIGGLSLPIIAVIAAVVALGVAIYQVFNHWDVLAEGFSSLWKTIGGTVAIIVDEYIKPFFTEIGKYFSSLWDRIMKIVNYVASTGSKIKSFFGFGGKDMNMNLNKNLTSDFSADLNPRRLQPQRQSVDVNTRQDIGGTLDIRIDNKGKSKLVSSSNNGNLGYQLGH